MDTYRTEPAGVPSTTAWLDVSDAHVLENAMLATSRAHSTVFVTLTCLHQYANTLISFTLWTSLSYYLLY